MENCKKIIEGLATIEAQLINMRLKLMLLNALDDAEHINALNDDDDCCSRLKVLEAHLLTYVCVSEDTIAEADHYFKAADKVIEAFDD